VSECKKTGWFTQNQHPIFASIVFAQTHFFDFFKTVQKKLQKNYREEKLLVFLFKKKDLA
jgi:hypothetical protein